MFEYLFIAPLVIVFAFLTGLTEKIADLLDEHRMKCFNGSNVLFGILFGVFGSLVIFSNNINANIMLAMVIGCILRGKVDYFNHQLSASIMLIAFFIGATFDFTIFAIFLAVIILFGGLRDYIGDKLKTKNKFLRFYDNVMWYYPVSTFIFCFIYGNWIVFWTWLSFMIAYDTTKYFYKTKGFT
jgi:hypothetical protein